MPRPRSRTVTAVLAAAWWAVALAGCDTNPGGPAAPSRDEVAKAPPGPGVAPKALGEGLPGPETLVGQPVPEFSLPDLQGGTVSPSTLKGKVVVIDFWAAWCEPCRKIAPVMQALHEAYGSRGLAVVGANTSERDDQGQPVRTRDRAEAQVRDHKYTYTFTYGSDDLKNACHVTNIPTVLVLDRSGVVRHVQVGYSEGFKDELTRQVEGLLAGK